MKLEDAARLITGFCTDGDLKARIAHLECHLASRCRGEVPSLLCDEKIDHDVLDAAFLLKSLTGQINVVIHTVAVLVSLPHILDEGEVVQYASLGAGNTKRQFDLETDRRVAEFKLIQWQGGAESERHTQLFKDLFNLVEYSGDKKRCLYLLGTDLALKFLKSDRKLDSVLTRKAIREKFYGRHGSAYETVSQYYADVEGLVEIWDLRKIVPELTHA